MTALAALGRVSYRKRWWVLGLASLFLAGSLALLLRGGLLTGGTIRSLESEDVQRLTQDVLGHSPDVTFVAVFQGDNLQASMQRALQPLRHHPAVLSVQTPQDTEPLLAEAMQNLPKHTAFALVTLRGEPKEALRVYPQVRKQLRSENLQITCTGRIPFLHDLDRTLQRDLLRAELLSLPLALIVLLLVFRTGAAAALPVGVGALSVLGGIAVVLALSHRLDVAQFTINVCSLIGLGVAIDYSLFIVARYREELARGLDYETALVRAMATAGRVVAFSGTAVGTGLAGLLFFEGSYLASMGIGGAIVVLLAVIFALTFLPALLAVLGPRIGALPVRLPKLLLPQRFWQRTAHWVMRRPLTVLLPTLALLLLMGVPFLHLRLTAADVRVLPADIEARRGYDLLRRDFPDAAANRIVLAVRFPTTPVLTEARISALYDLAQRMKKQPHVVRIESLVDGNPALGKDAFLSALMTPDFLAPPIVQTAKRMFLGKHVVLMNVVTDLEPDSVEARALVRQVRQQRHVADGTLRVGGQTANDLDATRYIAERTPRAIGFIVLVTLLMLFAMFRSVLLPLKAVAMNFLSITGSFGALVWIFQDGHLFVQEGRPIEPALPPLLFCVLFGLSMDYEVLMLSRIREAWLRTGDNTLAVAEGLEKTAGLITSAASIMVVVFGAFALASVVLVQAVGFGMALAVALDATLVRVLLVPATMRLFGAANWWGPKPIVWLRRWWWQKRRRRLARG